MCSLVVTERAGFTDSSFVHWVAETHNDNSAEDPARFWKRTCTAPTPFWRRRADKTCASITFSSTRHSTS